MADSQMQEEMQKLRDDLSTLQSDVADLTRVLRDLGIHRAEEWRDSVADEYERRREQARERINRAKTAGRERLGEVEDEIGNHPLATVFGAFGLGFIIAKMMDLGGRR